MSHRCVHHLIEAQAARTPAAPAVVSRDGVLSYAQLDEQAGRLAGLLAARGVRPEIRVGLAVEQSARWLVTLLAVWKAGGVYVPIDAALPAELAASMLADVGVELLLHSGSGPVPAGPGFSVVELVDLDSADPVAGAAPTMWPDNLAYCMFTSGSTGRPKPIGISHAALAGHAAAIRAELGLQPADRLLQFTSMAIDASLEEVLPVWLAGGTVVLPDAPRPTSVELTELITARGVTVVSLPSAYWHQWTDDLRDGVVALPETLRTVFVGGDKIRMDKFAAWSAVVGSRPVDFVADYGPTETTISCTTYRPDPAHLPDDIELVPIGRPLPGVTVRLLDDDLTPVADGEPGGVWIAGSGLARGYPGAPAATADRFWPDPFGPPGTRMYRTGDRALRLPDGNLQFLGRSDRQVKIRGFRIEPGQVENAVRACAGVRDAVVVAVDDPVSGARLIAYVEADAAPDAEAALRDELAGRLPAVMLPQTIVRLDRIPRSPLSGKALPSELPPPPAVADRPGRILPSTMEQTVAGLVAHVLGRSPGADEDFFAAGGDSLRGLQLLSRIAQATGAALSFDQLRSAPTVAGLTALVEGAQQHEPDVGAVTPTGERDEWRPVSRGQAALWYLDKLHRGAATYAVPLGYWISGPLDVDRMDAALTELLARHEALRTTLSERDGRVWSRLQPPVPVRTRVTAVADRAAAARRAEADAARPFDLSTGPLLRSSCYRVDDEHHLWLLNVHHSAFDAWSLGVFRREFAALYQGRRLPEPAVRYADYVAWQERWLASEEAAGQRRYWRDRLSGDAPAVEPGRPTGSPGQAGFSIPLRLGGLVPGQVEDVARACGSTPFGVLLAGFFATLHRMTGGADDIVVGVPMAGRGRAGTEELIGYLVNTVPLRMRFTPRMSFRELVERTDAALAEALSRQDLPFSEMTDGIAQGGDAAENPVFQTMFVLQSTPVDYGGAIDGLEITEQLIHSGTAKVALTCTLRLDDGQVTGEVEYATRRFDRPSADRWQDALVTLLESALAAPSARLAELPLLPLAAATAQLTAINADHRDRGAAGTLLHDGFRAALARDPSAVAVQAGTNAVSYAELDARSEAIAATLAAAGIGPESLVGVCVERSVDSVAAVLGVLRAGAGFVPLDAGYPAERLRWIAADSAMAAVITSAVPAGLEDVPVIDPASAGSEGGPDAGPDVGIHPRNTAFVYYTSGSTGRPKGVIIDHGCAASRVEWIARRYELGPGHRVVHKTPLIFDVAIWEIFATLGAGATVLLAEAGTETDVPYLAELLATPDTVLAHFVPSMLDMYLATVSATKYPGLDRVQTSGEAVPAALLRRFAAHFDVALDNAYGQTETSEVALWSGRDWPDGGVPMGRAVNGYRLFVLDEALQPVAPGVVGELHVAGVDGLARGYLGRPDLTAERFLPHPWPVTPGERLYRTGDLAVRDDDGLLHYAGRSDGQAKVRGVRVEPGEIEEVLRGHPAVEQAAVRIREDEPGAKEIVAYLVGPDAVVPDVAEYAAGYLSRYLLPAVYVKLAALPLTPSGKVDRQALPAPTAQDRGARAGISETTSLIESQLAEVWRDLLNVEEIGRRQNFFEAGGSSLSALQMLHRVKTRFGVAVTVRQFFSAPTIAGVAEYLEKALVAELAALSDDAAAQSDGREG